MPSLSLFDMHVHLDFMLGPARVAHDAAALGLGMLAVTVTPGGYERAVGGMGLAGAPNVRVAAGLHPWWLADGRCGPDDVAALEALVGSSRYVGEVGLDFSPGHVGAAASGEGARLQVDAFERVCAAASRFGDRVLSIHAVRSASVVLDVLERTGCRDSCACVLHWFSGSGEELVRARRLGCLFSVSERMLATRRGRAYAAQIPLDRLLLETDDPPGENVPYAAADVAASLRRTVGLLDTLRGEDVAEVVARTSRALLRL